MAKYKMTGVNLAWRINIRSKTIERTVTVLLELEKNWRKSILVEGKEKKFGAKNSSTFEISYFLEIYHPNIALTLLEIWKNDHFSVGNFKTREREGFKVE